MSEYPVHDKGDTDHVAAVFKDGQEQEQERHLRCEAEDGAKSADHAIGYCADEHTVRVKSSQTVCHSLLYPGRRDMIRLVTIWSILSEVVSFSPDFFTAAFTTFWIKA